MPYHSIVSFSEDWRRNVKVALRSNRLQNEPTNIASLFHEKIELGKRSSDLVGLTRKNYFTGQKRPIFISFTNAIPLLQPLNDMYVSPTPTLLILK